MKIKHSIFLIAVLISIYSVAVALPPGMTTAPKTAKVSNLDTETMIDINSLQMFVTNVGGFAEDWQTMFDRADGLYYPAGSERHVLYSAGIWIGGLVNGNIRLAVGAFDTPEYFAGPADDNGNALMDDASFKVYKIMSDLTRWTNPSGAIGLDVGGIPYARIDSANHWDDFSLWENYVGPGAPPLDDDDKPLQIGDQTLWSVFNDGDDHTYNDYGGGTEPLGVELQSTYWGYNLSGPLGSTIFVKWIIINKGSNVIDSCFVSLWADPDLGGASDDLVGCDTTLSLGYCYNATNNDNTYGTTPPAVGFDFLQGPIIRESDNDPIYATYDFSADTVFLNDGSVIPQAVKLGMTSFNKYKNGTDPDLPTQGYGYMKGLDAVETAGPYIDPVTNDTTKFFGAGDPVTGTGWNDSDPADRRYMLSTGPWTFNPGDTQIVVAAIIVGQAGDRLASITQLKTNDLLAQKAYDLDFGFPGPPPAPVVEVGVWDRKVVLSWGTDSEVDETDPFVVDFEGYRVYQGETDDPAGVWTEIAHFDLLNGVDSVFTTVYNQKLDDSDYVLLFAAPENGIKRYLEIDQDHINGGKLHNGMEYFYAVTAYNYSLEVEVPLAFRYNENSKNAVTVVPQDPMFGQVIASGTADTVAVAHTGPSDGSVNPIVMDAYALTGDDYEVSFEDAGSIVWHMVNTSTGDTLLNSQDNQTGDGDYQIVDGMYIEVTGPPYAGVAEDGAGWDIPSGTRRYTWAGGGGAYGGMEGFGGAMGYASAAYWFGSGTLVVQPPELVDVLLVHATVDIDGNFDTNDTNVSYGYRYGRGFTAAPARPEFTPFMVNTADCGGYCYQGFEKSVPLSAWDLSTTPPRRLAVAHLENNTEYGLVDGKYWPPYYAADTAADGYSGDNGDGSGPREWLWIILDDYSETPNPYYETEVIGNDSMPVMYFVVAARRADVAWSQGATGEDQFQIIPYKINTDGDVFAFTATAPEASAAEGEADLENIRVVPNPYYAFSAYERDQFDRQVRFLGVPEEFTIRIFNLAGDKVRTLKSDDPIVKQAGQSWAQWNLATDNGLPVASGVYIWYLESEQFGTQYGKMAVFPEVEQLNTY